MASKEELEKFRDEVKNKNYYEILGISKDASEEQIKKAYRAASLKFHPDRNIENTQLATNCFNKINEANEVLMNGEKRAAYDRFLAQAAQQAYQQRQQYSQVYTNPYPGPHFPPPGQAFLYTRVPAPNNSAGAIIAQHAAIAPLQNNDVRMFNYIDPPGRVAIVDSRSQITGMPNAALVGVYQYNSSNGKYDAVKPQTIADIEIMIGSAKAVGLGSTPEQAISLLGPNEPGGIPAIPKELRMHAFSRLMQEGMYLSKEAQAEYQHLVSQTKQTQIKGPEYGA